MKKIIFIVDVLIVIFIITAYSLYIYSYFCGDIFPEKIIEAIEVRDTEYLEMQFSRDAMICIVRDENENRYRAAYIIGQLEEQLPMNIVSVQYLHSESVYEVVYCEYESEEEKCVYVTYAVNRVNPFQTKITGMSIEFVE